MPLPAEVGRAVRAVDRTPGSAGWVPLVLALEWAEANPEEPASATGPDVLKAFWSVLTGSAGRPEAVTSSPR